jgi:hypothetical protein
MRFLPLVLFGSVPAASGFLDHIFQSPAMKPDLLQITEQQEDKKLKIQLHLGNLNEGQMTVSDLLVELHHENADYEHVILPGADGKHRHLSCGHRRLDVLSPGHYIDVSGTQYVATEKGCWEMCWRKGKPAGTFVCGFELPETYERNAMRLPKGVLYLSFPLWTKEGLKVGQEEKRKVEQQSMRYLCEHDEALHLAEIANNPIMKAIHLRNAESASEKHDALPHETLDSIPSTNEVVNLQDDLLLTTKGLIFSKQGAVDKQGGHLFLGMATVSLDSNYKRLMS